MSKVTLTVLKASKDTNTRVIVASIAADYGLDNELPITEASVTTPLSPYGPEKLTIDHYTRLYHDLYDVDAIAYQSFGIYGPRQTAKAYSGVIGVFTEQAIAGEPLTVHGEGTQTRDFVSIEDIVQANLRAAQTDAAGVSVNLGTGSSISTRELAELIVDITDSDSEIMDVELLSGDIDQSRADIFQP